MLYTRNNLNCAEPLFEQSNSLNVNFSISKKTVWLIHGYRPTGSAPSWLQRFLRILLNQDDINIIVVDWNRGATTFLYNRAVKNTRKVAMSLSGYIRNLLVRILYIIYVLQYTVFYAIPQSGSKKYFFLIYIKNYCFDVLTFTAIFNVCKWINSIPRYEVSYLKKILKTRLLCFVLKSFKILFFFNSTYTDMMLG